MATCPQQYFGCNNVSYRWSSGGQVIVPDGSQLYSAVVLAGTEVDFVFNFNIPNDPTASYNSISWSLSIPSEANWLRLAGAYWNTDGQTSSQQVISGLTTANYTTKTDFILLTASGITPPPGSGQRPHGWFHITIPVTYTASGSGGSCSGIFNILFGVQIVVATRYKISTYNLIDGQNTPGLDNNVNVTKDGNLLDTFPFTPKTINSSTPAHNILTVHPTSSTNPWAYYLVLDFLQDTNANDSLPTTSGGANFWLYLNMPSGTGYTVYSSVVWDAVTYINGGLISFVNAGQSPDTQFLYLGNGNDPLGNGTQEVTFGKAVSFTTPGSTPGSGTAISYAAIWRIEYYDLTTKPDFSSFISNYPGTVSTLLGPAPPPPPLPPSVVPTTGYLACRVDYDWPDPNNRPHVAADIPIEVDTFTGIVLAGTECDFQFRLYPVDNGGLSSYDTINWVANIASTCNWLRLAGAYWNTVGQSQSGSISVQSTSVFSGDILLHLTASGINPPSLPPAGSPRADTPVPTNLTTTVTINYTATGPGGVTFTGSVGAKFAIRVFKGNRYKTNIPAAGSPPSISSWSGVNASMSGYPLFGPCTLADLDSSPDSGTILAITNAAPEQAFSYTLPLLFTIDSAAHTAGVASATITSPSTNIKYYVLTTYVPNIESYSGSPVGSNVNWNAHYQVVWPSLDTSYPANNPSGVIIPSPFPHIQGGGTGSGTGTAPIQTAYLTRSIGDQDFLEGAIPIGGYGYTGPSYYVGTALAQTDMWTLSQSLTGGDNNLYWPYIHYYSCTQRTALGAAPLPPVCTQVALTILGTGPHAGSQNVQAIPFDFAGGLTSVSLNFQLSFHGVADPSKLFAVTPAITLFSPPTVSLPSPIASTGDALVYQGTFTLHLSAVVGTPPGTYPITFGNLTWFSNGYASACSVPLIANAIIYTSTPTPTSTTPAPGSTTTTTPAPGSTTTTTHAPGSTTTTTTLAPGSTTTTTTLAPGSTTTTTTSTPGSTTTTTTTSTPGSTTTTTTTTMPPPPPGFINYEGPAVDESGAVLHKVPFRLIVNPVEIHVQADQHSGLLSGDFQVGVQVQPGPVSRSQIGGVVDLVRLYVDGDSVQFFSQLPQEKVQNQVVLQLDPLNWDLRNGVAYDLTFQLAIKNLVSSPFFVNLNTLNSIPTTLVAAFSRNNFTIESGAQENILVAVQVAVSDTGREILSVAGDSGPNNVIVVESRAAINLDPNVSSILTFYKVHHNILSQYIYPGDTLPLQFLTENGNGSAETWGVSDVEFLSKHGLRFDSTGFLKPDPVVIGPAESEDLMFFVEQTISPGEKAYASKIITIQIT